MIWIQILVATMLVFIILKGDVFSDFEKWIKEDYAGVHHTKEGWRRYFLLQPSIILYTICLDPKSFWSIVIGYILSCLLTASWYWTFFNGWYNTKRDFFFFYKGTNDEYDAGIDNLTENIPTRILMIIQISLIVISTLCYLNFILSWRIFGTNLNW